MWSIAQRHPLTRRAGRIISRKMKKVLLFAPYFLPRQWVGAMRPFRYAIHLRDHGWDPVVLTIPAPGQRLTERKACLLETVPAKRSGKTFQADL